jgi:tetratricopeptide (TPR) repeat protein
MLKKKDRAMTDSKANSEALYRVALNFHQQGRLTDAVAAYRRFLNLQPNDAEAHNNLGVALKSLGHLNEAVICHETALRLQPNYPEAHNNLGAALRQQGKIEEAIISYQQALKIKPDYAQAHSNLGNALQQAGRGREAIACYSQALRYQPNYIDAYYNLGITLMNLGDHPQAETAFQKALSLRPIFPQALNNLGNVMQRQSRLDDAAAAYQTALRQRPDFADAAFNLGNVLRDKGAVDEAVIAYRDSIRVRPNYAEAHNNLANLFEEQGDPQQALKHVQEALRLRPNWAPSLFTLAELSSHGHYKFPEPQLAEMEAMLSNSNLSLADASQIHFAIGLLQDKAHAHDKAFAHYLQGNALKHRLLQETNQAFNQQAHQAAITDLITTFDSTYFQRIHGFGLDTDLPVFIVGMPRSGTTLVEQILSSHPQVFGAGELRDAGNLIAQLPARLKTNDPYPRCMIHLDKPASQAIAKEYRHQLALRSNQSLRVTDKAIQNFLHLGLLYTLFPRAKIIHCRRDPRDVCVSCFLQYFRDLNFTWSLDDLGFYYRQYERIMQHWQSVLPTKPLEVVYEDLVTQQESISRQIVAFCGLEWDDRCLNFHDNRRSVQTMSKFQVRQPMYTSSVARWKRYESHLQPLLKSLNATPYFSA